MAISTFGIDSKIRHQTKQMDAAPDSWPQQFKDFTPHAWSLMAINIKQRFSWMPPSHDEN